MWRRPLWGIALCNQPARSEPLPAPVPGSRRAEDAAGGYPTASGPALWANSISSTALTTVRPRSRVPRTPGQSSPDWPACPKHNLSSHSKGVQLAFRPALPCAPPSLFQKEGDLIGDLWSRYTAPLPPAAFLASRRATCDIRSGSENSEGRGWLLVCVCVGGVRAG